MNKMEKEAIEKLKHHIEFAKEFPTECFDKEIGLALNYIDKQQNIINKAIVYILNFGTTRDKEGFQSLNCIEVRDLLKILKGE